MLTQSRTVFRIALFVAVFGIYMDLVYDEPYRESADVLTAHAKWKIDEYLRDPCEPEQLVEARAGILGVLSSSVKGVSLIERDELIADLLVWWKPEQIRYGAYDRSQLLGGSEAFRSAETISDYIATMERTSELHPYLVIPDTSAVRSELRSLIASFHGFDLRVSALSLAAVDTSAVRVGIFCEFPNGLDPSVVKRRYGADFEVRRNPTHNPVEGHWRAPLTLHVKGYHKPLYCKSFAEWVKDHTASIPVPTTNDGQVDFDPIRAIEWLVGEKKPGMALEDLQALATSTAGTSSLLNLPIDYSRHAWIVLVLLVVLMLYALLYVAVAVPKEINTAEVVAIGWPILLKNAFYRRCIFVFEILVIGTSATLAAIRTGGNLWYVAIIIYVFCIGYYLKVRRVNVEQCIRYRNTGRRHRTRRDSAQS